MVAAWQILCQPPLSAMPIISAIGRKHHYYSTNFFWTGCHNPTSAIDNTEYSLLPVHEIGF
jgi:hypothetical protein